MDEVLVIGAVALAPVYGFAVWSMWSHASYQMHMLRRIDQSATETEQTETVPTK